MVGRTAFAALWLALCSISAAGQESADGLKPFSDAELVGDVSAGRMVAEELCSSCHEVIPGAVVDEDETPPAFTTIAQTPGMTEMALTVWLTTFHPERTMPAIALSRTEREDLIAYILWLGEN